MKPSRKHTLASRCLGWMLGVALAVQPAAAAGLGCGARSLLTGEACCCSGAEAPTPPACCAARAAETESPNEAEGSSLRSAPSRCECEVSAPDAPPAVHRSGDARGSEDERAGSPHAWIAAGASASAAAPWFPYPMTLDPPGSASAPALGRSPPAPDAVARACARGVNGLLAVLGVVRA